MSKQELYTRLFTWRPGRYARDSAVTFGWLVARAAAQTVLTLAVAGVLGAEGYGLFIAALALAGFFVPLATMGLGPVLVRDGARQPELLPEYLRQALALWGLATLIFSLLATAVISWALPTPVALPLLLLFAWSEIAASSLVELAARAKQAQQQMHAFGALQFGLLFVRLLAVLTISWWPRSVQVWLLSYAGANLLYLCFIIAKLVGDYRLTWPKFIDLRLIRAGFPFVVGAISLRLQGEFNKPLLAQANLGNAGNFNIAQRVLDLVSLPLLAMQEALWPRVYSGRHARRNLLFIAATLILLALCNGGLVILAAPYLPRILGAGFDSTADVMVWLAWLPTLQVVRNLLGACVVARQRQSFLSWVYTCGGAASVLFSLWLVPSHDLHGAVWACYLTEVFVISILIPGTFALKGAVKNA